MSLRDWTKTFRGNICALVCILVLPTLFSSCENPTQAKSSSLRSNSTNSGVANGASIYTANPVVLHNNTNLTTPNWSDVLTPAFITDNFYLTKKCGFTENDNNFTTINNCIEVKNDRGVANSSLIQKNGTSWTYTTDSDQFYQVNAFYHVSKIQTEFMKSLAFSRDFVHNRFGVNIPAANPYRLGQNFNYWTYSENDPNSTLQVYSRCYLEELNAFYDPSKNEVCLGWNAQTHPNLRFVQDPSIIYHEMGHVFVRIMMNLRNQYTNGFALEKTAFESDLGELFYDEAGAINEGIADYFSYLTTNRKVIGEWAAGEQARPMNESEVQHQGRIPAKLRYPEYLHYMADDPINALEDIHNAGQIVSHYLVTLTQELKDRCSMMSGLSTTAKQTKARNIGVLLLSETFAELGDMTARGSDFLNPRFVGLALEPIFFTNLNSEEAYLWSQQVNPINFRRFFKTMAKNIKYYISEDLCPEFSIDDSEALLDSYGLLIFKSYNDTGRGINQNFPNSPVTTYNMVDGTNIGGDTFIANQPATLVNEANRTNSVLVSKTLIGLPTDRATAFVIDSQAGIRDFLSQLTFEGKPVQLSEELADPRYNNGNVKISPGEVVAIALNLVNNSNSTMAGVQILGNDWDHMQLKDINKRYVNRSENLTNHSGDIAQWEPCQIGGWPLDTEGGVVYTPQSDYANQVVSGCEFPTRTNKVMDETSLSGPTPTPRYDVDAPQPICMVQSSAANETRWISQDEHRSNLGLSDSECLNSNSTGGGVGLDFNPNECLIRVLPGANQATFGKIDPQKTWTETISANREDGIANLNSNSFVAMEVNKWIQPGTVFNCRFRVRFSNCQDCYNANNSGEDFMDFDFAGEAPYKVINFSFTVID